VLNTGVNLWEGCPISTRIYQKELGNISANLPEKTAEETAEYRREYIKENCCNFGAYVSDGSGEYLHESMRIIKAVTHCK